MCVPGTGGTGFSRRLRYPAAMENQEMVQPTRPIVGINADLIQATKTMTAHARINVGYFDAVFAAGGLPLIVPPLAKERDLNAILDRLDGVVLSGGLDMDPRRQQ